MYSLCMYIDSHCHLDFSCFDDSLPELLLACKEQEINAFLVPGTTAKSWPNVAALAQKYREIKVAFGLHPYFLEGSDPSHLELLKVYLSDDRCKPVAVGEIGLDKWPGMPDYEMQKRIFSAQLELAQTLNFPIIVHARKSEDDLLKILRQQRFTNGGVVHAFNGSLEQAKRFIGLGFVLGIGGTVTYPRAKKAKRVLQALADQDYVLETDAPDMPLYGYQGQVNTPERILLVAQEVAALRKQHLTQIAHDSCVNLQRVLPRWHEV